MALGEKRKRREENDDDKGDLMKLINKCASTDGFS